VADRRAPSGRRAGHRLLALALATAALALAPLALGGCGHDAGYPVAPAPDDPLAMRVSPSSVRPGQPFIAILDGGGDPAAAGWTRRPALTWEVERDGRWIERWALTPASRARPPAVVPGDRQGHQPSGSVPAVGAATYETPDEVAPGRYRVCASLVRAAGGAGGAAARTGRSCAPITVARSVAATS
jgi:hypothetical protein